MAGVYGALSQVGFSASGSPGAATQLYEVQPGSNIGQVETLSEPAGTWGSRSMRSERTRANTRRVTGTLILHPNPVELDQLLPSILGAAESTDIFDVAETLPTFSVVVDKVTKVFTYATCAISKATFRGSAGGPLELQLDIEGLDSSVGNAGTFPSLTLNVASPHYLFADCAFSLSSTAYKFRSWELTIDNMLDTERYLNSLTRISLQPKGRIVTVKLDGPYGDNSALFDVAATGIAVTATFTNGNVSVLFDTPKVCFPANEPVLSGKDEIMLPLEGLAKKAASSYDIRVTNDSAP